MELVSIPGLDLRAFLSYAEDTNRTHESFAVMKAIKEAPQKKEMSLFSYKAVSGDPAFVELFEKNYHGPMPTNEELNKYEEGTLAKTLYHHLVDNNITLDFQGMDTSVYYNNAKGIVGYMGVRALNHHDALHCLLDRGVTDMDELAVGAFQLAQMHSPYHMTLISSFLLNKTFIEPSLGPETIETFIKYYELGKRSKFVFSYKFEENWDTPIEDIKKELIGSL